MKSTLLGIVLASISLGLAQSREPTDLGLDRRPAVYRDPAEIGKSPRSSSGRSRGVGRDRRDNRDAAYQVMRIDGDRSICTFATPEEVGEIRVRQEERPSWGEIDYLVDSYLDREISVTFTYDFPSEARDAFQAAVNIWDSLLEIRVPIRIRAEWEDKDDESPLAWATNYLRCSSDVGCIPLALADQFAGRDLDPGEPDMTLTFFDYEDWYFGVDEEVPPEQWDLITVALHEIAHSLGFSSGLYMKPGDTEQATLWESQGGHGMAFDHYLFSYDEGWKWIENYSNPSRELYEAATSSLLFWGHRVRDNQRGVPSRAVQSNGGPVLLWAPETFGGGSSVSHVHAFAYPQANPNSLMSPWRAVGFAIHRPGPVILGMLYDMGWELEDRGLSEEDILRCLGVR